MIMSGARSERAKVSFGNRTVYEIKVTIDDIRRKFEEQNGCCYWTGLPLRLDDLFESYNMEMPSIDRLDAERPYEHDNIVITSRFLNVGRGRMTPERTRAFLTKIRESA